MDLESLDLNLLRVFEALVATKSVTAAGERLGLTQSAVSNALRRLREAFDDPLFVRTPDGMCPTSLGAELAEPVLEGLAKLRAGVERERVFDAALSRRTFRLYVSDVGQMVFVPRLMRHLAQAAPGVRVETLELPSSQAEEKLIAGEIDLAAGYFLDFNAGFYKQTLFSERYVCVVDAKHPSVSDPPTVEQYLAASHVVYRPAGGSHASFEDWIAKLYAQHGAVRRVTVRLAHSLGLIDIVQGSALVLTIPSRLAHAMSGYADLRVLPLPFDAPRFDITQQWHERLHHDPAHQWLRATMVSLFGERGAV